MVARISITSLEQIKSFLSSHNIPEMGLPWVCPICSAKNYTLWHARDTPCECRKFSHPAISPMTGEIDQESVIRRELDKLKKRIMEVDEEIDVYKDDLAELESESENLKRQYSELVILCPSYGVE